CWLYYLLQNVLIDLSILHNHGETCFRHLDQLDVRNGISLNEEQIGERAFLDYPQLAGVRVSRAGERQQLSVVSGGPLEHLGWRVPAGELSELPVVLDAARGEKQRVCAPGSLYFVFLRQAVCILRSLTHLELLGARGRIGLFVGIFIVQEWLQAPP